MQPDSSTRELRVFVVDDIPDIVDTLALAMRLSGFDVTAATSGAIALAAAEAHYPDALLTDIGMPGLDGYELAKRIRGLCPVKPLLIALSGYSQETFRDRARAEGFDHYFVKPADPMALAALLQEHARKLCAEAPPK